MKGVSTVIAIVLILMITVALAALAYVWFLSVFQTISTSAGESIEQTGEQLGTQFTIQSSAYTGSNLVSVGVQNTGTQNLDLTKIAAYISNQQAFISSGNTGTLTPGLTTTLKVSNSTAGYFTGYLCNKALKMTGPTGQQQITTISSGC